MARTSTKRSSKKTRSRIKKNTTSERVKKMRKKVKELEALPKIEDLEAQQSAFGSQRANCVRAIKIVVAQAALDPTHHSTQKLLDKMNELDFREESQYLFMELCKHDGMTGSQLIGATMRNLFEVEI
jgi:hypothetical protein